MAMNARYERRRARRPPSRWEEGSATAEFAMILPAVVVMAVLVLSLTRVVVVSMDCQDAAAAAAREAVLAGDSGNSAAAARTVAGSSASVTLSRSNGTVTATVHCPVLPGPLGVLPTRVTGTAVGIEQ